jgi:hypothetical protein
VVSLLAIVNLLTWSLLLRLHAWENLRRPDFALRDLPQVYSHANRLDQVKSWNFQTFGCGLAVARSRIESDQDFWSIMSIPMLTFRTKLLLALIFAFGLGIGLLSGLSDGLYSAACLLALPFLVALAGASIIADFSQEPSRKTETTQTEQKQEDVNWPRAA